MAEEVQPRAVVYVGMPSHGAAESDAVRSLYRTGSKRFDTFANQVNVSLLAYGFNMLWCGALNRRPEGVKYFAMLHGDIVPDPWWIDTLIDELEANKADLVSAVVPIKTEEGVTSTAIDDPGNPWGPLARLTVRQAMSLPKTFSAADCGFPDRALLVNTGCFVCRFDGPWVEHVWFHIEDSIERVPEGYWAPLVFPEDWNFSRVLQYEWNLKVMATTAVKVAHVGKYNFGTGAAWGLDEDPLNKGKIAIPLAY